MSVQFISHANTIITKIDAAQLKRMKLATAELKRETLLTFKGTRSGRRYRVPGTRKMYSASAPGEAPAVATGSGKLSIREAVSGSGHSIKGHVGSAMGFAFNPATHEDAARYLAMLEFEGRNRDGSRRAARPWLRPSAKRAQPKIKAILKGRWF